MKSNFIFSKYSGIGNDFIIFDSRDKNNDYEKELTKEVISKICDRNFGIGADGVIFILESRNSCYSRMKIINSDSTEAEMCGNGIRCMIKFLFDKQEISINENIPIETLAGNINCMINNDLQVNVDMGQPIFDPKLIPTTSELTQKGIVKGTELIDETSLDFFALSMGNPHMIIKVDSIKRVPLSKFGPLLECSKYFPSKTNVHFVELISRKELKLLVWERGCGPTLACGTGACAAFVTFNKLGLVDKEAVVYLPGGQLIISWKGLGYNVFMTGQANKIFEGSFNLSDYLS